MAVFAKQAVELADILEPAETAAVALVDSTAVAGSRVVGVEPAAAAVVEEPERHAHHSEDAWESAGAAQSV